MKRHKKNKFSTFISNNLFEVVVATSVVVYIGLHTYLKDNSEGPMYAQAVKRMGGLH